MRLWVSRSMITKSYTFWRVRPSITWSHDEIRIGNAECSTGKMICHVHDIHKIFPKFELPPGEMMELEITSMEGGYYIGIVDE